MRLTRNSGLRYCEMVNVFQRPRHCSAKDGANPGNYWLFAIGKSGMIVVFGSINVDLVFQVPHLPIAGETVMGPRYDVFQGGKGANQATAAARAGARTEMVGAVGTDPLAADAVHALQAAGVGTAHVRTLESTTGCAAIGVDRRANNQIMVASGANGLVEADFLDPGLISADTILVLQMEVPLRANWAVIERVKAAGGRVVLNVAPAAPVPESVLSMVDFLIVNEVESAVVARSVGIEGSDPTACGQALAQRFGFAVIVTLGARGSVLCEAGSSVIVPTASIRPVDTTGAGDTFCGVFAASLDRGLAIPDAMRRASVAGALSCLGQGARTAMPDADEIAAGLARFAL